ncbi:hypothetical protein Angca_007898, partial [Angiostrongylus cantonensis]
IYLLRHGETVWNTQGRFQGQKDSPLTERGIAQADTVADRLCRAIGEDARAFTLRVSPLGRTLETAARIQRRIPLPVREDATLMEVTTGSWDGLTHFEIGQEFPGGLDGADAFDWYFRSPDGESFDAACTRARTWLATIDRPTIAVSHGLFGRIIRGVYLGLPRAEMLTLPVP